MKKYLALLLLGVGLVLNSGCYKKARQAEEDDGLGVSLTSKWDWSGTAPLSGTINGSTISIPENPTIVKLQVNSIGIMSFQVIGSVEGSQLSYHYALMLKTDLKPGVHVATKDDINFNFNVIKYTTISNPTTYLNKKLVLKLIKNNDEMVEGYFYGKIQSSVDAADEIEVKNAYFKFDKSGMVVQ